VYRNTEEYKDIYEVVKYMLPNEEEVVWYWYADILFRIKLAHADMQDLAAIDWVPVEVVDAEKRWHLSSFFVKD
jgi:hypothetical protein